MDRTKGSTPLGTALSVGLRAADVALQYSLLNLGWGAALMEQLGGQPVQLAPNTGGVLFGLDPYYLTLTGLALDSALKHIIWVLGISEQVMPLRLAVMVAAFNTVNNSVNSLLSLWSVTTLLPASASGSMSVKDWLTSPTIVVGLCLYLGGILTEIVSEFQRKAFKADPANKGKPYGGGLSSLAAHINYGGYVVWRSGYAITAAGLPWGLVVFGFLLYEFTTKAIPSLDQYCSEKVRWLLMLPFVSFSCRVYLMLSFSLTKPAWIRVVWRCMDRHQETNPVSIAARCLLSSIRRRRRLKSIDIVP